MKKLTFLFYALYIVTCALFVLITAAAGITVVVLLSAGLLSVVVSLGSIIGVLSNVASDLSPQTMLLTGLFCAFSAAALALALYIVCPKAVRRLNNTMENYLS